MPSNLLKNYNQRLELLYMSEGDNLRSLRAVFNRDFQAFQTLSFAGFAIRPTTAMGEDAMDRLFRHLTTVVTDQKTKKREFESDRSIRIHWIKYHFENAPQGLLIFSVADERRTYILDRNERYVIVLEPLRKENSFFLLSAYQLQPASYKAILSKYEKRGTNGIVF